MRFLLRDVVLQEPVECGRNRRGKIFIPKIMQDTERFGKIHEKFTKPTYYAENLLCDM